MTGVAILTRAFAYAAAWAGERQVEGGRGLEQASALQKALGRIQDVHCLNAQQQAQLQQASSQCGALLRELQISGAAASSRAARVSELEVGYPAPAADRAPGSAMPPTSSKDCVLMCACACAQACKASCLLRAHTHTHTHTYVQMH